MKTDKIQFRCANCGNKIPMKHLKDGSATQQLFLPDSECSVETYESTCCHCMCLLWKLRYEEKCKELAKLEHELLPSWLKKSF